MSNPKFSTNLPRATVQKIQISPKTPSHPAAETLDYEKFYYAVSMAESGNCKSKLSRQTNNCTSIMEFKHGKRNLVKYPNQEIGKQAFIALWKKSYKTFPNLRMAEIYTGNDKAAKWLAIVKYYYFTK